LNLRFELWSLITIYQRPLPKMAEDIGTWQIVFTIIMVASVLTNAGLAVFTMDSLSHLPASEKFWLFVRLPSIASSALFYFILFYF